MKFTVEFVGISSHRQHRPSYQPHSDGREMSLTVHFIYFAYILLIY